VLVVVAGSRDEKARDLAERWGSLDAAVLTPEDLSVAGWRHSPDDPELSRAVVDGRLVAAREITGVLTRSSHVSWWELTWISREDRAYVASEMTAFLRSWLASRGCPVLNPPSANCLSGPGWGQEQAVYVAAGLGIPVRPVEWRSEPSADVPASEPPSPDVTVTVVGGRCLGSPDRTLSEWTRSLAGVAGVDLLAAHFEKSEAGTRLCGADPWPDVSSSEVADAMLGYFLDGRGC
jgi:hypothetical protein